MKHLWILALLYAGPASAAEVFLNGVSITGVVNQSFENCTVRLDDKGNVHIEAKGYAVKTAEATPATTAVMTKRYFLWINRSAPTGFVQYDVDLLVNGRLVRHIRALDAENLLDVTPFLNAGANVARFIARKDMTGGRLSTSAAHRIDFTIGEGKLTGPDVLIERPLYVFKRTAADTDDVQEEFTFVTR